MNSSRRSEKKIKKRSRHCRNASRRPSPNRSRWTYSAAVWFSTGQTDWNHTATSTIVGDPTSELIYRNLFSYTGEIAADFEKGPWFFRTMLGYGAGGGELIDDDYVSAAGATAFSTSVSGPHRISRTLSDVEVEDVFYAQFDAGRNFIKSREFIVGGFLGYQYWTEQHVGTGIEQLECTSLIFCAPVGTKTNQGEDVITNTVYWHSLRVGLKVRHLPEKIKNLELLLEAAYIPLTFLTDDDVHHLRSDLAQSPSIRHTGRGSGFNIEAALKYNLTAHLLFKVAYRYWDLEVEDGKTSFLFSDGTEGKFVLNSLRSRRHGGVVGLEYQF